jgi:glycosyltransferase involved in cell wall biosynthesis
MAISPALSVVVPMYDEEDNAAETVRQIRDELEGKVPSFEIVAVDDGSKDGTRAILEKLATEMPELRPTGYRTNRGRGAALRTGFAASRGRIVVSIDADLSYGPDHIVRLYEALTDDPEVDVVLGSAYMPGGRAEGVPFGRLAASRLGNLVLRQLLPSRIHTSTCILRAYRREALDSLLLHSEDKDIHLEILAKALALGLRVKEVPAVLRARKRGGSKFRFRATAASHLLFGASEKPMIVFGLAGLALLLLGVGLGLFIVYLRYTGQLNPTRPLMTMTVIVALAGGQFLSMGFIAFLVVSLRRDLYRVQRQLRSLEERLGGSRGTTPIPLADRQRAEDEP